MSAILPVLNQQSPLVEVRQGPRGKLYGYLLSPWNSFFQQLTQVAPAVQSIIVGASPYSITPNDNGNFIITGGTISDISLIRGLDILDLTGQKIIPISLGDTLKVTYTVVPVIKFLGA